MTEALLQDEMTALCCVRGHWVDKEQGNSTNSPLYILLDHGPPTRSGTEEALLYLSDLMDVHFLTNLLG